MGHIDLLKRFSYIEVPERDAQSVMDALTGVTYKGREVRCNDADEGAKGTTKSRRSDSKGDRKGADKGSRQSDSRRSRHDDDNGDWRSLIKGKPMKLRGEVPDFSEEGWARKKKEDKARWDRYALSSFFIIMMSGRALPYSLSLAFCFLLTLHVVE